MGREATLLETHFVGARHELTRTRHPYLPKGWRPSGVAEIDPLLPQGGGSPVTTAELMSGTHGTLAPRLRARIASGASLVLGVVLLVIVPALLDAADYVAVLGGAAAVVAIVGGGALWSRPSLTAWTTCATGAATVCVTVMLELVLGLPGAGGLPRIGGLESGLVLSLASGVLLLTAAGRPLRRPEETPQHPYAL